VNNDGGAEPPNAGDAQHQPGLRARAMRQTQKTKTITPVAHDPMPKSGRINLRAARGRSRARRGQFRYCSAP